MADTAGLVVIEKLPLPAASMVPNCVEAAGAAAQFAWDEFFQGTIRNRNTRIAYLRAVRRFLSWAESEEPNLARITPGMVGRYFDELPVSVPSKKLHLAAIRAFLRRARPKACHRPKPGSIGADGKIFGY